jgi:hypothetical protein
LWPAPDPQAPKHCTGNRFVSIIMSFRACVITNARAVIIHRNKPPAVIIPVLKLIIEVIKTWFSERERERDIYI